MDDVARTREKNGQLPLPLGERKPQGRGGWRPGAGRPRSKGRRNVEHRRRPALARWTPVHVTLRCRKEVGRLRRRVGYRAVREALGVTLRRLDRFRIVHVSIQHNHLHLIVEARDRRVLGRGMQGFSISCARQINRRLGRRGGVFADRYHARALGTPREVRHGLNYVLNNWRHHQEAAGARSPFDPYSSASAFAGWTFSPRRSLTRESELLPTAVARFWLLTSGWKRRSGNREHALLISPMETPGSGSAGPAARTCDE